MKTGQEPCVCMICGYDCTPNNPENQGRVFPHLHLNLKQKGDLEVVLCGTHIMRMAQDVIPDQIAESIEDTVPKMHPN